MYIAWLVSSDGGRFNWYIFGYKINALQASKLFLYISRTLAK